MKISGKEYRCTMPSSWAEITRKDWLRIAHTLKNGSIYDPAILSALLKRKNKPLSSKIWDKIPTEGLYPLYEQLDWLKDKYCISPPFEYIRIRGKRYYLPAERLENIPVIEFAYVDMCMVMIDFFERKKQYDKIDEWIDRMCAYLCRPIDKRIKVKDPNIFKGDRREKFNPNIIDRRVPMFSKIDARYKLGVLWFVIGCKRYIHNHYKKYIFPPTHTEDGQEIIGRQTSNKPEPQRWMNIIRKLSGGKFGDIENTRYANLYDVLNELRDQMKNSR